MHLASARPAGDPGLPPGPQCLANELGVLASNPSSVKFLKIQSPSLTFPTHGQAVCERLRPAVRGGTGKSRAGPAPPFLRVAPVPSPWFWTDGQPASLTLQLP